MSDRSKRSGGSGGSGGSRVNRPPQARAPVLGTTYLLHLDRPLAHAQHYTGWAQDLPARLARHAAGRGARLLQVARERGIGWTLARTWPDTDRAQEKRLKNSGSARRYCPICKAQK